MVLLRWARWAVSSDTLPGSKMEGCESWPWALRKGPCQMPCCTRMLACTDVHARTLRTSFCACSDVLRRALARAVRAVQNTDPEIGELLKKLQAANLAESGLDEFQQVGNQNKNNRSGGGGGGRGARFKYFNLMGMKQYPGRVRA